MKGDYKCSGLYADSGLVETWPYDYAHFILEWCKIDDPSCVKYSDGRNGVGSDKIYELLDRFFGTSFEEGDFYDPDR